MSSVGPWPPLPPIGAMYADEAREGESGKKKHTGIVFTHCVWKGLQMGGVLGIAIGTPYILLREKLRGPAFFGRLATVAGTSAVGFMVVSGAMCMAKLRGQTPESIFDRAYRLNHNQEQSRCDWFALGTAAACAGTAFALKNPPGPRGALLAGLAGFGGGVFLHIVTKPIFAPKKK